MAVDMFIKFAAANSSNKVDGESQDKTLNASAGWSAIRSVTFGGEHKASIGTASTGAGGGKTDFKEFVIKKYVDIASPPLFLAMCSGAHFNNVELHLRKAVGGTASSGTNSYLQYMFYLVFVTKIDTSLEGDGEAPEETITFEYGAMSIQYQMQAVDGSMTGTKKLEQWSRVTNDRSVSVKA